MADPKELQAPDGQYPGRFLLIMPVLLQTALFPFAATLEVTGNTLAIYNQDGAPRAASCWSASPICPPSPPSRWQGEAGMTEAITAEQGPARRWSSRGFLAPAGAGGAAKVQLIIDGRRSSGGQVAAGYINQVIARWQK